MHARSVKKLSYRDWRNLQGLLQRVGRRTSAKIRGLCLRFLSLCVLLTCTPSCVQRGGTDDIQDAAAAIRQQIAKYTAALDAADTVLASEVWLTSPEVSFISPAGHQHGWEEVKALYEFFGTSFSERKLTVRDVSVHVLGDSAWAGQKRRTTRSRLLAPSGWGFPSDANTVRVWTTAWQ